MRKALAIIGVLTVFFCSVETTFAEEFTFGSAVAFNANQTNFQAVVPLDSTHILVVYSDNGTGKASVGTISGTDISFASSATFEAASVSDLDVKILDSTHVVIVYQTSTTAKAVIATISGNSISYGTAATIDTNISTSGSFPRVQVDALDSTHFVVTYAKTIVTARDQRLIAGSVSGTSITMGTSTSIYNANRSTYNAIAALDSSTFVVLYHTNTGVGRSVIGTVTGTSISTGSLVQFAGLSADAEVVPIDSTHYLIAYRGDSPNPAYAAIGTVSGLSTSFGSATQVADGTSDISLRKLDSTTFALAYSDWSDFSDNGAAVVIHVDGSTITADDPVIFSGPIGDNPDIARLDSLTMLVVYTRSSDSHGYGIVGALPGSSALNAASSSSSSTTNKRSNSLTQLRLQNGLDARGFPLTSSQSSSSSSSSPSSIANSSTPTLTESLTSASSSQVFSASVQDTKPAAVAAPRNAFDTRTCERVMKWFKGNSKMLERVNARLMKRFGFECT